jgi:uracil-DNA glycosylase
MRLLIVDECPSSRRGRPLEGQIGRRIAHLAGVSEQQYLDWTIRAQLFSTPSTFSRWSAAERATWLGWTHWPCDVVALGARVARAFRVEEQRLFEWQHVAEFRVAVCPHPSARNRWWLDPRNEAAAASFWRLTLGRRRNR